jgi:hypothetical protein
MRPRPRSGDTPGMSIETCEFIDVALSLQQAVREKVPSELGLSPRVVIGTACGAPAVVIEASGDGTPLHLCELHRQRSLVNLS